MVPPDLADAVLARLGFGERPPADRAGLDAVYRAWCERVPFDNLVKRIHLASGSDAPIPNGEAGAFLRSWLRDGCGGTCWPSSAGLHALLVTLGFEARRGSAAMYDDRMGPVHTHGTVLVRLEGADHWVDSSMLTRRALPLERGAPTRVDDPVHAVRAEPVGELWRVWWKHPVLDEEIGCLLLDEDATREHYLARYEWSRGTSPFNTALYATRTTGAARVTLAFGRRFERTAAGVASTPLDRDRERVLVDEFGYSEEIVARLPPDDPPAARE